MRDTDWGDGCFDDETVDLFKKYLRDDELELAHRLHPEKNWPQVNVSFKTIGRKKDRHLGLQTQMLNYRDHLAAMLCRLVISREETALAKARPDLESLLKPLEVSIPKEQLLALKVAFEEAQASGEMRLQVAEEPK